jgi:hypothetical protein
LKTPVVFPPGPVEAGDEAAGNGIVSKYSNDRDCFRGRNRRPCCCFAADGDENGERMTNNGGHRAGVSQ